MNFRQKPSIRCTNGNTTNNKGKKKRKKERKKERKEKAEINLNHPVACQDPNCHVTGRIGQNDFMFVLEKKKTLCLSEKEV